MKQIQEEDEEIEADGANYQLEMMRCLREVNVDNNTVGWYELYSKSSVFPDMFGLVRPFVFWFCNFEVI